MQTRTIHRRSRALAIGLLVAIALIVMVLPAAAAGNQPNDTYTLTVLHTNDTHANIKPCTITCSNPTNVGGVARRYTAIQQVKAQGGNVLLVDAGDSFQGTLFFNYWQGQEEAHFMNALGYQAAATGNHEFDSGPPALARYIQVADFPVLGANIDASAQVSLTGLIEPYTVVQVGGQSIGIFGLTTEETPILSSPGPDVHFSDHVAAALATVATLQAQGINKIVVLSHLGYDVDQTLAAGVSGIDVIVGGHSHTPLGTMPGAQGPYPTVVTSPAGQPVLVVSAWEWGKYLGRVDVTFDASGVVQSFLGNPILIDSNVAEDPAIAADVAVWEQPILQMQNTVVAATDVYLDGDRQDVRTKETNMGDMICDALLWQTRDLGTQICMTNGGGIRAPIPEGDITLGQILTVLPFGNTVATLGLRGSDVIAALENGVSQYAIVAPPGRFPQVGGMRYTFDPEQPVGHRILSAEVKNPDGSYTPIDANTIYKLTTNNFMRTGGDGYSVFATNAIDPYDTWAVMADSVVDYIQAPADEGGLGGTVTAAAYPLTGLGRITLETADVNRSRRFNVTEDTFIDGTQPNASFGNAQTMWVGFDDQMRPVVQAPFPVCDNVYTCVPSNAIIDTAYLYLYVYEGRDYANWTQSVMEVAAHPITSTWTEAATWVSPWTNAGGDMGAAGPVNTLSNVKVGTWLRLDVTDAVEAIVHGAPNYGFALTSNADYPREAPNSLLSTRFGFTTSEFYDPSKVGYMRIYYRTYQ